MKRRLLFLGVVGSVGLVSACHDHGDGASNPTPPPSTSLSLSTAQVLSLAEVTSETSTPTAVNNGALTLNDTSETSAPVNVDKM